ncbi:ABC transporter substrate-binding protein [Acetobacter sp. AN02]|uniref:MlaC/ttg2D family ABC transporter substrate-binding protein n=1 Tax=Acetobacter sp. AN02 TaxID=2894186 RepID=UPI0024344E5A|nr:ABC transporter substrate-binding protein [Acetobacter sp. AN02]MDG6095663.1 ABC transporter substrate-binding protein [Acetobacter sp. AN02]
MTGLTSFRGVFAAFGLMAAPASLAVVLPQPAFAQAAAGPVAPVSAIDAALTRVMMPGAGSFAARAQVVAAAVDQAYDLEAALEASVGPARFAQFTPDEKQKLLSSFREYTIARYVSSFGKGSKATFRMTPDIRNSPVGSDKIVSTQIVPAGGGDPTDVDYVVRQTSSGWRITDVLLQGHISQAAAQRSDFSSTLASGGAEGLIAILNRKVQAFAAE